jgi:hypothetical protein
MSGVLRPDPRLRWAPVRVIAVQMFVEDSQLSVEESVEHLRDDDQRSRASQREDLEFVDDRQH